MSHPLVGHDYTEKSSDETNKEYKKRAKAGMSVKSKVANKMPVNVTDKKFSQVAKMDQKRTAKWARGRMKSEEIAESKK